MSKSLAVFMSKNGYQLAEGKIYYQKSFLKNFLKKETWVNNILEIGFNAGHSADFMLSQRDDISVTSVDLAKHNYVIPCSSFISQKYPNRFKFVRGDSRYVLENITDEFDFIFIDGGHSEDIPYQDIVNCKRLSNEKTIVMLDDYQTKHAYQRNVKKCFDQLSDEGFVKCIDIPHRGGGDGWILYKYV